MSNGLKLLMLTALMSASGWCANVALDVENLPRANYKGANGVQISFVRYNEQNWTEIDPAVVLSYKDTLYKEVCFEGKFESYFGAAGIKLTGVDANIAFEDKAKRKAAPDLKQLDNVWICGYVQPSKDGRKQDVLIYEIAKLPPDIQRFENKFMVLERDKNIPGLIDLGSRIDQNLSSSKGVNNSLGSFERMGALRDKCFTSAIMIKEKNRKPNDPQACYEIAVMYKDYLRKQNLYRAWILKTLEIDPSHSNASRVAEQELNMRRVGDSTWMPNDQWEQKQKALAEETKRSEEDKKRAERERGERLQKEIAERTVRLLEYQAAMRTSNPEDRVGALTTLGDAIRDCLDPGFGLAAIDILSNMSDDAAILPGMDRAARSSHREVRQQVYATLAWRGTLHDDASQIAYEVLGAALKSEKDKLPAQTASDVLAGQGSKQAVGTLIAGLESNEPAVCEALMGGLKKVTNQPLLKKEEWQLWWSENKEKFGSKAVIK